MRRALLLFGLLALASPGAAAPLLGEPKVDRPSNQYDGRWCPADKFDFNGVFVADGPEVTIQFIASNYLFGLGDYRRELLDNVFLVPLSAYDAATHLPTPALIAAYYCIENDGPYFHFQEVPPTEIIFSDQFPSTVGLPWETTYASWIGNSAINSLQTPVVDTGGALFLADTTSLISTVTTSATFTGLTPGETYVITFWENVYNNFGTDLTVQIYGTEWFSNGTYGWLWNSDDTRAVSWVDYDGDGDQDLYTLDDFQPNQLFRNDGGFLWEIVGAAGLGDAGPARSVAWADADNDGDLDVHIGNSAAANLLGRNDGGTFVTFATTDNGRAYATNWVDYDLDGDVDCYTANLNQANRMLRNDGNFNFASLLIPGLDNAGAAFSSAWGDYDDDGDPDLYLVNSGSSNKLFRNDGGGSFADVTVAPINLVTAGRSAVWGDYDNDEDLDLFVVNQGSSDKLFRNDGGTFVDATPTVMVDLGAGSDGRFADWDNDGDLDIYLVKFAQPNVLYRNDGSNGWAIKNTGQVEEDGLGNGFAWGDFDGDGGIDMYVGNDDDNVLYRNEQAYANAWLHVDLEGTISNRSGIGARITVEENGQRQIREVSGGDGRGSFDSLTAEFGFGPGGVGRTGVDLVEVRWPSGIVQTLTNVPAYQRITIVETDPTPAPEVAAAGLAETLTLTAAPNPSLSRTTLRFTMPRDGATDLRIYDAAGRLVRVLDRRQRAAGAHAVRWDGDDTQGRSVAPGVYFARLECAGEHAVQRIVRIAR